jgi:hypothetical protein
MQRVTELENYMSKVKEKRVEISTKNTVKAAHCFFGRDRLPRRSVEDNQVGVFSRDIACNLPLDYACRASSKTRQVDDTNKNVLRRIWLA